MLLNSHASHDNDSLATIRGRNNPTSSCPMPTPQPCEKARDRRLLVVLTLIENSLRRHVPIRELGAAINLSPGRLAHLFKIEIGVSPQRYLNNIRLEKAAKLLENGLRSIKEIADEVGIPNTSFFCRSFKVRYGITPREYRKTHLRVDLASLAARQPASQSNQRNRQQSKRQ